MIKAAVQIYFTMTLRKFSQLFFGKTSYLRHLIEVYILQKLYLHFFKGVALYLGSSAVPNCVMGLYHTPDLLFQTEKWVFFQNKRTVLLRTCSSRAIFTFVY